MAANLLVDRNKFQLQKVIAQSTQEVTVPASLPVPDNVQYLLKPILFPVGMESVQIDNGKVRVQGQLGGLVCGINEDESVIPIGVEPVQYSASFPLPMVCETDRVMVDAVVETVEVDKDEQGRANIIAFVSVTVTVSRIEEVSLVTDVSGAKDVEKEEQTLQVIVCTAEELRELNHQVGLPVPAEQILATQVQVTNLNWQVLESQVAVEGKVSGVIYFAQQTKKQLATRMFEREFSHTLPVEGEVSEAIVTCAPQLASAILNSNNSGVDLTINLGLYVQGYREVRLELLSGVGGADFETISFAVTNRVGESEFRMNLDGHFQISEESATVLSAIPEVRVLETTALDEKIMVRGVLSLLIFYAVDDETTRAIVREDEFNQFFALSGSVTGMTAQAQAWCEESSFVLENGEVQYTVPALFRVDVKESLELNPIVDLHIVDPHAVRANASVVLYRTQTGENLFAVAKKFNVTQQMLRDCNRVPEGEQLPAGTKLTIPLYLAKYNKEV
ncbi:MAG: LysM peptidoglycan-binding domain-containing protein [Firmicutes bacterium]|nr:LysM peptidoglycan-binding domain-containing protein [Bacillota bacterium]